MWPGLLQILINVIVICWGLVVACIHCILTDLIECIYHYHNIMSLQVSLYKQWTKVWLSKICGWHIDSSLSQENKHVCACKEVFTKALIIFMSRPLQIFFHSVLPAKEIKDLTRSGVGVHQHQQEFITTCCPNMKNNSVEPLQFCLSSGLGWVSAGKTN